MDKLVIMFATTAKVTTTKTSFKTETVLTHQLHLITTTIDKPTPITKEELIIPTKDYPITPTLNPTITSKDSFTKTMIDNLTEILIDRRVRTENETNTTTPITIKIIIVLAVSGNVLKQFV